MLAISMRRLTLTLLIAMTVCAAGRTLLAQHQLSDFSRQQLTSTYYSEGVSVGDINQDGHPDVVYGPYWFAGPDFSEKHEIYPAKPQPMERYADHFFSWVYDFNGDGAGDVLTVGFPGTAAFVYENPGDGIGQWTRHEVLDWVSNESPQWTNLVGDERPELVCTRDGFFGFATVDWDQPWKGWQFHPVSEQVAPPKFGHGLGVGDVDRDGRLDILHAGGWLEQPAQRALNRRWRPHAVSFSTAYGGAEMYAYDVDGDGDNDILTAEAAHDYGLSWYEQTGSGEFRRHTIMGTHRADNRYGMLFTEPHSLAMADMDGDGLQDLVTGKTYWSHHKQSPMWNAGPVVVWFKLVRGAEGVDWIPYVVDDQAGIGRQVTMADVNGDQLPDVVTGGMLGAHVLRQQRREVSLAEYQAAQPKVFTGPRPIQSATSLRGSEIPVGSEGRVAEAIEAEELTAAVTAGSARPQGMKQFGDRWSAGSQLWWTGARPGDQLTLEVNVLQDIEAVQLAMTCARDYGIVQVVVDDQPLGEPIDLYDPAVVSTGQLEFAIDLKAGQHELQFEIVGANSKAAKAYMFGLDYLRFRPVGQRFEWPEDGVRPIGADGQVLNLDFENGSLEHWTATGQAFEGQPVRGDTVSRRRNDMRSRHFGDFWIGGYEHLEDGPTGTLTSEPFRVTARYATFYVGGGKSRDTRVDLIAVGEDKPFYSVSGRQSETLSRVVVDLRRVEQKEMMIRLVDESSGGWGHINFDHFRLHRRRPGPVTPAAVELTQDEYPFRGLPAEEAAAAMLVPEGFEVIVSAAEPDVRQPIAMALDDRGRTWIAEAYEYPQRAAGDQGRDRILIFEDTTGDGKFDSRKVFAEGLNLVSGLEVGFGGVWVGAAPYLLFIPDRDADDVPDGEPQVLLDGWGYQDTHETLNAFIWGPDGWLYGCHGVFTHSKVGPPGTPDEQRVPINAGVWRYHPVRHQFEVFAHGTSNPWGVDFNAHGDAFITACVIPHLYHMIPGARYQRQAGQHFNPYTYDDIKTIADHLHYLGATPHTGNGKSDEVGGGHAHAGAMVYQGGAWPSAYDGVIFMNNIHGQRLNTEFLRPEGSGYVGEHGPDFLKTQDMASQILNMRYGPDGQVTMIDWYDMQACHRKDVEIHDRSNGRIYQIRYVGESDRRSEEASVPVGTLVEQDDESLAQLCLHANNWYVRHARRLLQERAAERKVAPAVIQFLEQVATTHQDPVKRLRAMWARHAAGAFDPKLVNRLLQDKSPHVRAWTCRLQAQQQSYQLSEDQVFRLTEMAHQDGSPIVRLALASITDRLPPARRWELVTGLLQHEEDAEDHNLPWMLWYITEPLADENPDRALAVGLSAGSTVPMVRDFMLRRLGGSGGRAAIERLVAGLDGAQGPAVQLTFLRAMRTALQGQQSADPPAAWQRTYQRLSSPANTGADPSGLSEQVRWEADALGLTFGDSRAADNLLNRFRRSELPLAARQHALEALLTVQHPQLLPLLKECLSNAVDRELRRAAIRGFAQYDQPEIGRDLISVYADLDDAERRTAVATLCSRVAWAASLLQAIDAGQIPATDLPADLARQLTYFEDEQLDRQLAAAWGQIRQSSADRADQIQTYRDLVERIDLPAPDLKLGKALFSKTCQRCHVLYGAGQQLGPDLTGSNRGNLDYLLENIVDPSAVMANEYRQSVFLTEDGQVITGIVRGETENAVTVQTAESSVILPKPEITLRKASEQSMMPEDQLQPLTDHQIRSLIGYLRTKEPL